MKISKIKALSKKIISLAALFPLIFLVSNQVFAATSNSSLQTHRLEALMEKIKSAAVEAIHLLVPYASGVAVLMLIIGGIQYMNNPEQGKKTLTAAIIGLIIVILAWSIVNIWGNLLFSS